RVKAEWGSWFRPQNKGGASRLDFCGTCASGTEDTILKYAFVMAARRGQSSHPQPADEEDDEGSPLVDEILERRERNPLLPREGPILTKEDRARLAAQKPEADDAESGPWHGGLGQGRTR